MSQEFKFKEFDSCKECGCDEVVVETVVSETATHKGGVREIKGGGETMAELSVWCFECNEKLWSSDEYEVIEEEVIDEDWEYGERCPKCNSMYIEEWHVDNKFRLSDGTLINDGDRLRTEGYYCSSCLSLLDKLED